MGGAQWWRSPVGLGHLGRTICCTSSEIKTPSSVRSGIFCEWSSGRPIADYVAPTELENLFFQHCTTNMSRLRRLKARKGAPWYFVSVQVWKRGLKPLQIEKVDVVGYGRAGILPDLSVFPSPPFNVAIAKA